MNPGYHLYVDPKQELETPERTPTEQAQIVCHELRGLLQDALDGWPRSATHIEAEDIDRMRDLLSRSLACSYRAELAILTMYGLQDAIGPGSTYQQRYEALRTGYRQRMYAEASDGEPDVALNGWGVAR